jgi:hypothetical protein
MESKLPSSPENDDDYEIPRGVHLQVTQGSVFLLAFGILGAGLCAALLGIIYVIARFLWALAFA